MEQSLQSERIPQEYQPQQQELKFLRIPALRFLVLQRFPLVKVPSFPPPLRAHLLHLR